MFRSRKAKVIVIGLNRSGTKLSSFLIAKACGLRFVYLEPFTWTGGVDTTKGENWKPQLSKRIFSKSGQAEHQRLPVYCSENEVSKWMIDFMNNSKWELVKFVEIGRAPLIHTICPNACIVAVIREPVSLFTSLNGSTIQKDTVAGQWSRLQEEIKCEDPLPDANNILPAKLADSARLYIVLHKLIKQNLSDVLIPVRYESLLEDQQYLEKIGSRIGVKIKLPVTAPMIGVSTKKNLTDEQQQYLKENLTSTYKAFLK